jgi:riboflavin biosynthesis pyrimidine reductase
VRQIYPVAGPEFGTFPAVTDGPLPAAVSDLAALYGKAPHPAADQRPFLRANMVASADGAAEAGGRSGPLGGPADRTVFMLLRSLADIVLVGAGTARAEHYRPVPPGEIWAGLRAGLPPVPSIAVISASLDLQGSRLLDRTGQGGRPPQTTRGAGPTAEIVVLTTAAAAASRSAELRGRVRIVVAGDELVDVREAIDTLGRLGYRHILTEGGPSLLGQLAAADLLDELCLTVSPLLASGTASRIAVGPAVPARGTTPGAPAGIGLTLAHVLADETGFLLTRYVRSPGAT